MNFKCHRRMFEYNNWANRRALESVKAVHKPGSRAVKILAHALVVEKLWLSRIREGAAAVISDAWPFFTIGEMEGMIPMLEDEYRRMLDGLAPADMDRVITYRSIEGEVNRRAFSDILLHIVNHSTYHRGQVATQVKAEGGTPAVSDFIVFARGE